MIAQAAGVPTTRNCLQYSNSNYAALAAIVEVASGQPFGSYLHEKIFGPLEMNNTSYTGGLLTGVQPGHFTQGNPTPAYHSSWANGAGGIVSTAADMAKWNKALMDDAFFDIVERAQQEMVTGPCQPNGLPPRYAFGWIVRGDSVMEHSGVVDGYSSYNMINPDKRSAVTVLSNYAGYAQGIATFARAIENAALDDSPGANFCCTPYGKFGPGSNRSGQSGQQCYWVTPFGTARGETCE